MLVSYAIRCASHSFLTPSLAHPLRGVLISIFGNASLGKGKYKQSGGTCKKLIVLESDRIWKTCKKPVTVPGYFTESSSHGIIYYSAYNAIEVLSVVW